MKMATRKTPGKRPRKSANNGASEGAVEQSKLETSALHDTNGHIAFEEIQRRAYEIYLGRGCSDGHDLADWFAAEHELSIPSNR
jgi:Protein of unknown function (DUF2934)